jgi:Putative Ig domain
MKLKPLPLLLLMSVSSCFATISIKTTTLPNGIRNDSYSGILTVSGGCSPYAWKIAAGSLPAGIKMTTSSGTSVKFSGTPTKAATYSFTMSVKACSGTVVKHACKIVVQAARNHVVDLSWDAPKSGDVMGYNVYRAPDGKSWSKMTSRPTASTVFTDLTAANNSTYYYAATAVDASGGESKKSNIAKSTIP